MSHATFNNADADDAGTGAGAAPSSKAHRAPQDANRSIIVTEGGIVPPRDAPPPPPHDAQRRDSRHLLLYDSIN